MSDADRPPVREPADTWRTTARIAWHASRKPDAPAIIADDRRITYAELAAALLATVRALRLLSVRPGMLVGIETPQRYLHLLMALACEVLGAASISLVRGELTSATPWEPDSTASFDDSGSRPCDVLLTEAAPAAHLRAKARVVDGAWLADAAHQPIGAAELALLQQALPDDRMVRVCRSSGTTGAPKLIAMSHAKQQRVVAGFAQAVIDDGVAQPRYLGLYGLTLRSTYYRVLGTLQHGGAVYFAREPELPELIGAGVVNTTMLLVGDLQRLLPTLRPPPAGHRLHLETVGAAVNPALRQEVAARLHTTITSYYSSHETGRIARMDEHDVGTLCAGAEVRIVDAEGREQPQGEIGLICTRTPTMVDGYWNRPDLTDAVFVDGWVRTSDLGRMPAPDRLVVLGRADDMLNLGGVKILPMPLEAQIKALDGVEDVALVVVEEPGETPIAVVAIETSDGAPPPGIIEQINPIVWRYLRGFELMVMRRLPRTDSGKVQRPRVAALFARARLQVRASARPNGG